MQGANAVEPSKQKGEQVIPVSYKSWLLKHGKSVAPELTDGQRIELRECFNLIDSGMYGCTLQKKKRRKKNNNKKKCAASPAKGG